jgi:hypothetical protein
MLATFVETQCRLHGDTVVSNVAWSSVDQIAALATNTVDDHDKEYNQIMFMTNEVI